MSHLQPAARSPARGHRNSLGDPAQPVLQRSHQAPRKTFVLCFDGTGNKFSGGPSDSNILKIYRMLNRNDGQQYHYYQPGIGTGPVGTTSLSHTSLPARFNSWYQKAKDSAVGTSFDEHVMGGYKFLMQYYAPDDEVYFFGFSRGAYVARFLAEMLDYVGLLTAGNEELTRFAWKTFARWQQRGDSNEEEKRKKKAMFEFMRAFRETFSRPVKRIRFLGLFDTVNSVPRFESAWMRRSKFPYTARSSAKVIRHAVSIDERRAKFRQDLISQDRVTKRHHGFPHHRPRRIASEEKRGCLEVPKPSQVPGADGFESTVFRRSSQALPKIALTGASDRDITDSHAKEQEQGDVSTLSKDNASNRGENASMDTDRSQISLQLPQHDDESDSDGRTEQDIEEVWFPGCHADVGGGWSLADGEEHALSHAPLVWMVREAQKAGLPFDPEKMVELKCCEDYTCPVPGNDHMSFSELTEKHAQPKPFPQILHSAATLGLMHDCLQFNNGLPRSSVLSWNIMEFLPFRRMDLQPDGSWKSIRWPLPKGEVRDIPDNALIHHSALRRMEADENYRPGNLIIGGGGRGVRRAPKHFGIGEWAVLKEEGDPTGEVLVRKKVHSELAAQ